MVLSVACNESAGAGGWLIAASIACSELAGTAGLLARGATEVLGPRGARLTSRVSGDWIPALAGWLGAGAGVLAASMALECVAERGVGRE